MAARATDTPHPWVVEFLSHLSIERGLAANTLISYRQDLTQFLPFMEARSQT